MKSYCLKCRKDRKNIYPRVSNTSNGRTMILSKCAICGSKKSRFVKNQETKGLLSNLGILDILFYSYKNKRNSKFLLAGDKFMPEMHLK